MDNFLLNVLAGVIASLIFYIISKLFRQVKTTQTRLRVVFTCLNNFFGQELYSYD
ncbi:Uncharacterised protein [Clostridioides difficile]|nr:Uncharacterised protein [Clostridioides difficile]